MAGAKISNPADCKDPACSDTIDMFKKTMKLASKAASKDNQSSEQKTGEVADQVEACPLSKGELGSASWGLIHTTAAHYPEEPSEELKEHTKAFFLGLAQLYPCSWCREDFKEEVAKDPPSVDSRLALSLWACRQHNIVNEKLGKPLFECTLLRLDERWKTGRKSCWVDI